VAAWQVVSQTAVVQSLASLQTRPGVHKGQLPPQSRSLSSPFLMLSMQVEAAQISA
jgi:hypothetical protein